MKPNGSIGRLLSLMVIFTMLACGASTTSAKQKDNKQIVKEYQVFVSFDAGFNFYAIMPGAIWFPKPSLHYVCENTRTPCKQFDLVTNPYVCKHISYSMGCII